MKRPGEVWVDGVLYESATIAANETHMVVASLISKISIYFRKGIMTFSVVGHRVDLLQPTEKIPPFDGTYGYKLKKKKIVIEPKTEFKPLVPEPKEDPKPPTKDEYIKELEAGLRASKSMVLECNRRLNSLSQDLQTLKAAVNKDMNWGTACRG